MAVRIVEEYYRNCPNCNGLSKDGDKVCNYCGTSLLKSKVTTKIPESETSDASTYTDTVQNGTDTIRNAANPVGQESTRQSGDLFTGIFMMIFGIVFAVAPLTVTINMARSMSMFSGYSGFSMSSVILPIGVGVIFLAAGILVFIKGLQTTIHSLKR